jgi:hypothetical protein
MEKTAGQCPEVTPPKTTDETAATFAARGAWDAPAASSAVVFAWIGEAIAATAATARTKLPQK